MDKLIDDINFSSNLTMLNGEPPKYSSEFGRRAESAFKTTNPPAPMVFSSEAGLVLYERVITTKEENHLLNKLTKPKRNNPLAEQLKIRQKDIQNKKEHVLQQKERSSSAEKKRLDSPGAINARPTSQYSKDNGLKDKRYNSAGTINSSFPSSSSPAIAHTPSSSLLPPKDTLDKEVVGKKTLFTSWTPSQHKPPLRL
mmetsp:Transcript_22876/g.40436  ORF Transcript_22876/g.40436 Transcript_22876/m.40436 type:complete len:198 (-) Transcript_22876:53-646(-)